MSVRHASRSLVDALPLSRPSNYVCRQCRRSLKPVQVVPQQQRNASSRPEDLPFAERVRRKLWKGPPPGPENVDELYGKGFIDTIRDEKKKTAAKRRELAEIDRELEEAELEAATEQPERTPNVVSMAPSSSAAGDSEDYKGAKTWDGLEAIGHKGDWREMTPKKHDEYTP